MKWLLVDGFDNIVHTVSLNDEYGDEEARKYFSNLKRMDEEDFSKLWKVMTEMEYNRLEVHNKTLKEYEEFGGWLDVEKS